MTYYIIMMTRKDFKQPAFKHLAEPMSYGRDGDIAPDRLLVRNRATLFESEDSAREALRKTLEAESENPWPHENYFTIIEAEPTT